MAKRRITINSILGGNSPSRYYAAESQSLSTVGIDPDLPVSDAVGDKQSSGVLRPSGYAKFSSTVLNATPYWIITNPKDTLTYVVLSSGRIVSYSSSLGSETNVGTTSPGAGNGAAYYNNYIYVANTTNVSRYGPLDTSPTLTDSVWTGATLGSQTALANTTYPSIRGSGTMPNHVMHQHIDGKLYVCDFDNTTSTAATRGRGLIHSISTTFSTTEGTGNNSSTYNALDLPLGFMPTALASYGTDLVIAAIQSSSSTVNQGQAALFFWDTVSSSFYNQVWLPDPLVTALLNNNGLLYVFSGPMSTGTDVSNGYRVSVYIGGQSIRQIHFSDTGSPPLAGAVSGFGDRILWGTFEQIPTSTGASPEYYPVVMAKNSKNKEISTGVFGVINTSATATAADGLVTALKNVQQEGFSYPKFAVGWRNAGGVGADKQSTTYGTAVWRSRFYQIGKPFTIRRIRFSVAAALTTNMTITPTVFLDDFSSSSTSNLTVVNSTNYAASERTVEFMPDIYGDHNFCLELRWSGTALLPVLLPITIEYDDNFNR